MITIMICLNGGIKMNLELTKEQNISMFLDTFVYMDQNNVKWKNKSINFY